MTIEGPVNCVIEIINDKLTCIRGQSFICCSCGMVLVTTTASKQALLILEIAGPENMPWVSIAYTFVAPASNNLMEIQMNILVIWTKSFTI